MAMRPGSIQWSCRASPSSPAGHDAAWRFLPALPAAHHAGHQAPAARRSHPFGELGFEDGGEVAARNIQDAERRALLFEHAALRIEQGAAQ